MTDRLSRRNSANSTPRPVTSNAASISRHETPPRPTSPSGACAASRLPGTIAEIAQFIAFTGQGLTAGKSAGDIGQQACDPFAGRTQGSDEIFGLGNSLLLASPDGTIWPILKTGAPSGVNCMTG